MKINNDMMPIPRELQTIVSAIRGQDVLDFDSCLALVRDSIREVTNERDIKEEQLEDIAVRVARNLTAAKVRHGSPVIINISVPDIHPRYDSDDSAQLGISTSNTEDNKDSSNKSWASGSHIQSSRHPKRDKFRPLN